MVESATERYVKQEVNYKLFSSKWEESPIDVVPPDFFSLFSYHEGWNEITNPHLFPKPYNVVEINSSDLALHSRIKDALLEIGVTEFFVSTRDEGDYETRWMQLYVTKNQYDCIEKKIGDQYSPPRSMLDLENRLEKIIQPKGLVTLGDRTVPQNWLDLYLKLCRDANPKDFDPAWNIPSKKELILELANHHGLMV